MIFLCFQGVALGYSATTIAQDSISPLNSIYACSTIADDTERLACFDQNVPALKIKEEKKEIVAIDAAGVKAIKRDSFGFSLPSLPKFGILKNKNSKESKSALEFKVKSFSKGRKGITLVLENGHVWQQTSGDIGYIPKGQLTAKIKPASLGSYFITLTNEKGQSGRRGARVKRIK